MGPGRTGVPASLALPSTWAAQPPLESQAPASSIQSVSWSLFAQTKDLPLRVCSGRGLRESRPDRGEIIGAAATLAQRLAFCLHSFAVPGTILLFRLPARNPRFSRLAQTVRRSSCRTCNADGVRLCGVGSGIVRAHTSLS